MNTGLGPCSPAPVEVSAGGGAEVRCLVPDPMWPGELVAWCRWWPHLAGNCGGEAVTDLPLLSHHTRPARRLGRNVPRPGHRGTVAGTKRWSSGCWWAVDTLHRHLTRAWNVEDRSKEYLHVSELSYRL